MKNLISKLKFARMCLCVIIHDISQKFGLTLPLNIRRWISKVLTNQYAGNINSRPTTHTLKSSLAGNWSALSNKHFFARHLPPAPEYNARLVENNVKELNTSVDNIAQLFVRSEKFFREGRSNVFFAFFAQWFTDGFFRSSLIDSRQTGSSHHVDLCQIYGINEETTNCLRLNENGYLRYQGEPGNELPPNLFRENNGDYELKHCFKKISYLKNFCSGDLKKSDQKIAKNELELAINRILKISDEIEFQSYYNALKPNLLAAGLERGNATLGNLVINTFFMRCHNRICDDLVQLAEFKTDGKVNDEKVFQTARSINIVLLIKFTIEEYINHIAGRKLFIFDPSYAEKQQWYREPWLAAEFNLLYRWHGLVPNRLHMNNDLELDFRDNPAHQLSEYGLEALVAAACSQPAGCVQMGNTPPFLFEAEKNMLELGRQWKLQPYNKYRKLFGLKPLTSIDELTCSHLIRAKLKQAYGHIDNVEFVVGVFAEAQYSTQLVGRLQSEMVAYEAFTQLYTNPLLAKNNYERLIKDNTVARNWIENTHSLDGLLSRISGSHSHVEIGFDSPRLNGTLRADEPEKYHIDAQGKQNRSSAPCHKTLKQRSISKQNYSNILCPHLRFGIRSGELRPDKDGWVEDQHLRSFLHKSGLKKNTLLTKVLLYGGRVNSPKTNRRQINLFSLKSTYLDHGSSSGIVNCPDGLNSKRLSIFRSNTTDINGEERLYTENFRRVSKLLNESPANFKAGRFGRYMQLLEFKIILEVYGKKDTSRNEKYLSYEDAVRIWKYAKAPKGWQFPKTSHIGLKWTRKTLYDACQQYRKNRYDER